MICALLILQEPELTLPLDTLSPWIDMVTRARTEVFANLQAQSHRRFIKTHTPLDGVPRRDDVTYIAVIRHPLDIALSDRDHAENVDTERAFALLRAASGEPEHWHREDAPEDPAEYLRWFVDNTIEPTGSGPYGLADYANQVRTYWDARDAPNVHLFHYRDMWADLDGEMRDVAATLEVVIEEARWPAFVEAATLGSMRSRASLSAPDAHMGMWRSPEGFFRVGGTRDWASLLTEDDLAHFSHRLRSLTGEATEWVLNGRAALG
jgi:hypothetical protein